MWLEEYIKKLPSMMIQAVILEQADGRNRYVVANLDMFAAELKSMNVNLNKIID